MLDISRKEPTRALSAAEFRHPCRVAASWAHHPAVGAGPGHLSTGPFPHRSSNKTRSSFLNDVWPAVSTPNAGLFNPLTHLTTPMNQRQPSIWLIGGQAVHLWMKTGVKVYKQQKLARSSGIFAKQGEEGREFTCYSKRRKWFFGEGKWTEI